MQTQIIFKINEPSVIWEQIETEIIAINLINGFYYDISGLSATIWVMIINKYSYQDIINELSSHYGLSEDDIKADANFFLKTLEEEQLVSRSASVLDNDISQKNTRHIYPETYQKPVLNKYTDMENLLLIDPIHEVDEHGWPNLYPLPQPDTTT